MKNLGKALFVGILGISLLLINSCNAIKEITNTLTNVQRLQFKLDKVSNFKLAGVSLYDKSSISSFSITDGINLTKAFGSKKFPAEFVLTIEAKNPNDGTKSTRSSTALLSALEWRLIIDDVTTITGNIDKPVEIPGTGYSTYIPLKISLDLYEFFQKKGYDGIVNLALAIGGQSGSTSKIKLDAKPTVSVAGVNVPYPGRITIIDKEFTN
jgi:hypothetical protein